MGTVYVREDGTSIEIDDPSGYFREALTGLQHGANRSCVREIFNAVGSDIYNKLSNFTEVNGDKTYANIFHRAEHKRKAKKPYEMNLIEELGKVDFLSPEQCEYLVELRKTRNYCSHPFGYDVPAANASYLLTQAVKLFLGEPSLSPSMVQEEIVGQLRGSNYFPRDDRNSVVRIVKGEIGRVIPAAYHRFIKAIKVLWDGGDAIAKKNSGLFVSEAIALDDPALRRAIIAQFVAPLLVDPDVEGSRLITFMVRLSPKWTLALGETPRERLVAILRIHLVGEGRDQALPLLIGLHKRGPELLDGFLSPILKSAIEPHAMNWRFPDYLHRPGPAKAELLKQYRQQAEGAERQKMVSFLDTNATRIAAQLSGAECYPLLVAVSGRKVLGHEPMAGISAVLLPKAAAWFARNPAEARIYARSVECIDPAIWFTAMTDVHSSRRESLAVYIPSEF